MKYGLTPLLDLVRGGGRWTVSVVVGSESSVAERDRAGDERAPEVGERSRELALWPASWLAGDG